MNRTAKLESLGGLQTGRAISLAVARAGKKRKEPRRETHSHQRKSCKELASEPKEERTSFSSKSARQPNFSEPEQRENKSVPTFVGRVEEVSRSPGGQLQDEGPAEPPVSNQKWPFLAQAGGQLLLAVKVQLAPHVWKADLHGRNERC
jgi:hypothetical protein